MLPFDFDYDHLKSAPEMEAFPTARPRSAISGERIEKIEKGQVGGINKSQYSKLEKNYVDSMKKIGDVLMIVQSLKLKKNDKDKIISTLVS